MSIKLYYDFLSQPSRALYIFFKLNKIPFEPCSVALRNGEHLTEEFKEKFNRFGKVPFIHDGGFKLSESIAIVRYVAKQHKVDNWYPKETKAQAEVDEYLEWQHNNTRVFCAMYFQKAWLLPILTGKPTAPEELKKLKQNMIASLDNVENIWLAKSPYMAGDKISIADVFAACEIEQPRMAGFDPTEGHPKLKAWLERVRRECSPHYEEAHAILNKIAAKGGKGKL